MKVARHHKLIIKTIIAKKREKIRKEKHMNCMNKILSVKKDMNKKKRR